MRSFAELLTALRRRAREMPRLAPGIDAVFAGIAAIWPTNWEIVVNYAYRAEDRGDLTELLRRWAVLRQRFPHVGLAHAGYASTLRKLNRLEEAAAILADITTRFPDDPAIAIEYAMIEQDQGNAAEALARWTKLISVHPHVPEGYVGVGTALRQLRRFDEADACLVDAVARFPLACFVAANYAVNADENFDRTEALRRWQVVRDRFPDEAIGYAGLGAALKWCGSFDAADALLSDGMRRFPHDSNIAINHLLVAAFRRDWREAARRWDTLRQRFPDDPRVKAGWPTIRYHLELADVEAPPLNPDGDAAVWPHREFFLRFASLGENCEFGFVQRHYGAEPLDLVRWTGISYDRLLQGLQTGFEGLGSPENAVVAPDPENIEYHLVDTTLDLDIHTSVFVGEEAPDRVLDKTCIRLRFLRTKLCRDLQTADKIFVFLSRSPLEASQCHALHAAIRRYGPSRLFCVRPHDAAHPPGLVEMDAEGVLHGFLDRTGNDGTRWGEISLDLWRVICKRAYHLHVTHSQPGQNENRLDDAGNVVSQTDS
jgi:Flp pilus assembly protein TadD